MRNDGEHVPFGLGRAQRREYLVSAGRRRGRGIPRRQKGPARDPDGVRRKAARGEVLHRHGHGQILQKRGEGPRNEPRRHPHQGGRHDGAAFVGVQGRGQVHLRAARASDEPYGAAVRRPRKPRRHAHPPDPYPPHELRARAGREEVHAHPLGDVHGVHRGVPRRDRRAPVDAVRHERHRRSDRGEDEGVSPRRVGHARHLRCGQDDGRDLRADRNGGEGGADLHAHRAPAAEEYHPRRRDEEPCRSVRREVPRGFPRSVTADGCGAFLCGNGME